MAIFELKSRRGFAPLDFGENAARRPGDYLTTALGRQPAVMTRHRDGSVHVR
jgi:hypothetical protein